MKKLAEEFLTKYEEKKVVIFLHRNADLDAVCSALALTSRLKQAVLCAPDGIGEQAKEFLEYIGGEVIEKAERELPGIVVDTGSYALIENVGERDFVCVIDHHSETSIKSEYLFTDKHASSCCEIVYDMLEDVDEKTAFILAVGILSDSARFKKANIKTFSAFLKLLETSKKDYQEMLRHAEPKREWKLKQRLYNGIKDAKTMKIGEYMVLGTIVDKNESDMASVLCEIGDVSFGLKPDKRGTRISARANHNTDIKLNEIMKKIGAAWKGNGGGHEKAAGAFVVLTPEKALEVCFRSVEETLRKG